MAYRRRQSSYSPEAAPPNPMPEGGAASLAAKAMKASSAYRDSSISSAYEQSALPSPRASVPHRASPPPSTKDNVSLPKIVMDESKQGFWGTLTRKAKAIIDDDNNAAQVHEKSQGTKLQTSNIAKQDQYQNRHNYPESRRATDKPKLQKGLGAIASSLTFIGDTIGNALEGGITAVENRTAGIIQETRKIQIRKKNGNSASKKEDLNVGSLQQQPMMQVGMQPKIHTDMETQLKASRDVAMAMAAKTKLLLRELKTFKADMAFAKERCAQLEDENRILRESRQKGDNPEDDDLVRLQLETLLAEKARLAQENSVYTRENRFLREVVEYHQLTMQDVVYLDEGSEEVTEVYPINIPTTTNTLLHGAIPPPTPTPTVPQGAIPQVTRDSSLELDETYPTSNPVNPYVQMPSDDTRRH